MEFFKELIFGVPESFSGGVAHSVIVLSLVIAAGYILAKIKIKGISLGITWILFAGIFLGHFGITLDSRLLSFIKEFGLILFVYSIGIQVGPGFFSAFRAGGLKLNLIAAGSIAVSVITTIVIHLITKLPISTMVGILYGAVTNTPGLGAAQQTYTDITGTNAPEIAMGYAVAYPLGVVGAILTLLLLRYLTKINPKEEEEAATKISGSGSRQEVVRAVALVTEDKGNGKKISWLTEQLNSKFIISRIRPANSDEAVLADGETVLHTGDKVLIVAGKNDLPEIFSLLGEESDYEWNITEHNLISRQILISKNELHGKTLAELNIRKNFEASITRVNRAGLDLVASPDLRLHIGDRVTIVGSEDAISHAEHLLGNSLKRLNQPNLIPIFVGILLGCVLGSIPIPLPGVPFPVKLGLAGGPLIVSILISRFGPDFKIVTYATASANLMLREVGIALFLASVGLGAGADFVKTIVEQNGFIWIAYGALITVIPYLVMGLLAKLVFHVNYYTVIGVLSGANTNPPALAFSGEQTSCDAPAVGYATVYPLSMFLRVISAQLLIIFFI
ncbi:MAG: putative transporter [Spirochaetes bacterium]|uniref:Transporter n=1 Tax=Candidatus Gallitreponema excrementavium TaxID=2840840 RepID=A0A9D9HQ81_9SPIR|nr:putative transporter [Candidatus Gallitreponema excrementavium]